MNASAPVIVIGAGIVGTATAMAWALTQSGFSRQLVAVMEQVPGGQIGFLAVTIVVFAILGSVLEGIPAIVLFGPLLFPAARALGVHDVHYAMVVILAMGILTHLPIRQVFKAARRLHRGEGTPHRSSLCVARRRLGVGPVRHLFAHTARLLATRSS